MTSYGTGRRIRLEIELPGGIVAVTVTDPTVGQAAAVNRMIDEWLRDQRGERIERAAPAPTQAMPKPGPMCPHCDAGPFLSGHALGAHKRSRHPKQLDVPLPPLTRIAERLKIPDEMVNGPAVNLCRCGHAERLHETDDEGRGECWYGNCDCTEYRAQETA